MDYLNPLYTLHGICVLRNRIHQLSSVIFRTGGCISGADDEVIAVKLMSRKLNVAIEGCCHGELDLIYDTIREVGDNGVKVDLLLVCGDFQCCRNTTDLQSVAVPQKYRQLKNFGEYVSGKKVAPVTTIFIGGNHEASNILQSLYYGGWVAPNIYFLGFGGVVWFGGIRIGGLSGIYNSRHYRLGHYENPPYTDDALRSVYHVREVDVFRMAHLDTSIHPINVFMSHDWPGGVWEFGDKAKLLNRKSFLLEDMLSGKLGSPPLMDLMRVIKPSLWFAAHLHVKFAAIVPHTVPVASSSSGNEIDWRNKRQIGTVIDEKQSVKSEMFCQPVGVRSTRFLALDKCLPGRDFLQVISVPCQYDSEAEGSLELSYDSEWLAIMRKTHHLLSTSRGTVSIQSIVEPSDAKEIALAGKMMKRANRGSLVIQPLAPNPILPPNNPGILTDHQTDFFLSALGLPHIWTSPCCENQSAHLNFSNDVEIPLVGIFIDRNKEKDPNQVSLSDDESTYETSKICNNDIDDEVSNSGIYGADINETSSKIKRAKVIDENEINFENDEDENDDDDDWRAAALSVTRQSYHFSPPSSSSFSNKIIPDLKEDLGLKSRGIAVKEILDHRGQISVNLTHKTDVISFDDEEPLQPRASNGGLGLQLPPPKGLNHSHS